MSAVKKEIYEATGPDGSRAIWEFWETMLNDFVHAVFKDPDGEIKDAFTIPRRAIPKIIRRAKDAGIEVKEVAA